MSFQNNNVNVTGLKMNKIALVTGGNSGIGFASCKLLKEKGYTVFLSGRNQATVQQAATKLDVNCVRLDMENTEHIRKVASLFLHDGLDLLVNNAAVAKFQPIENITEDDFTFFFNINVRGPLLLIRETLPALAKRKGCIINVSSIVVDNGLPDASLYAATKGAIDALTRSLALELAPKNIRVNAVSPGATDTPILQKLGLTEEQLSGIRAKQEAMIPLRRYASPEEIAEVIVAQAQASYVTGSIWTVDGGVSAV